MAYGNGYNVATNKSYRAEIAENNGLLPTVEAIKFIKSLGIKGFTKRQFERFFEYDEWHHTSSNYKKTYYYSKENILKYIDDFKLAMSIYKKWIKQDKLTTGFTRDDMLWLDSVV